MHDTWALVCDYMRRTVGIVLTEEQSYLLDERLGPLARQFNFSTTDAYVVVATRQAVHQPEAAALIDGMTTHESHFFRDISFWYTFEKEIMPSIWAANQGVVRIWTAGCAHGQETYSVAMMLAERWPDHESRVSVWATDVSAIAVQRARHGVYSGLEVNRGLSPSRLIHHFESAPGGFSVCAPLRRQIIWGTHNILNEPPPMRSFDIILCRNVMLYFNDVDRQRALRMFNEAAAPHAYLGVGAAEQIDRRRIAPGWYRL